MVNEGDEYAAKKEGGQFSSRDKDVADTARKRWPRKQSSSESETSGRPGDETGELPIFTQEKSDRGGEQCFSPTSRHNPSPRGLLKEFT